MFSYLRKRFGAARLPEEVQDLVGNRAVLAYEKPPAHSLFEFSLCLSRACLGKMLLFLKYRMALRKTSRCCCCCCCCCQFSSLTHGRLFPDCSDELEQPLVLTGLRDDNVMIIIPFLSALSLCCLSRACLGKCSILPYKMAGARKMRFLTCRSAAPFSRSWKR